MHPEKIIIHHADVKDGPNLQTGAIRKWHVEHNHWQDIGYHALVELIDDRYEILMGRPWWMDGAHTLGQNTVGLGLCFVGDFNEDIPTEAQLTEGAKLIRTWMDVYVIAEKDIYPHNKFNVTDCPGKNFDMDELKAIIRGIR